MTYYGFVAFNSEPLQLCGDMLRQGFDLGMSIGTTSIAFLSMIQHMKTMIISGEKLSILLGKVDYYWGLATTHQNVFAKTYLSIFRETISILIDKGASTSSQIHSNSNAVQSQNISEAIFFHKAIQAYWQGHNERCHHYVGKISKMRVDNGKLSSMIITFIHGINTFQMLKRQNTAKLRSIPNAAISTLKTATAYSRWNFRNKVHLLEAENFSFHNNHEEAKASYAAAITSARCSRFIHEQALGKQNLWLDSDCETKFYM